MSRPGTGESSTLRTWAMVLGFLIVLLVVLGGFAWLIGSARHAQGPKPAIANKAG